MQTRVRSSLKPYQHKKRHVWYPRGTYPIKDPVTGQIRRKKGYLGTASDTRALCQVECDRLNRELEAEALGGPQEPTFEEAVATYLTTGGDKRFLGEVEDGPRNKLLDALGHVRVDQISDAVVAEAARRLYPRATAATLNRQLYTPVISVLRLAAKGKPWKPNLTRPKGHTKLKPAEAPPDPWWAAVLPYCRPQLAALLLFCTTTSRRACEAMRCEPEHFDPETRSVLIGRDKNGNALTVKLADDVVDMIQEYDWRKGPGLFGHYVFRNRRNLYRDLELACKRAGAEYFTPHVAGRHAFAKRYLKAGRSLPQLMGAGGWKSAKVPAELYGHFAHSEVADDARQVGEEFLKRVASHKDNVVNFDKQLKRRG